MVLSFWQELQITYHQAFRTIVPPPDHRTPWTWNNAHWAPLPFIPLLFMAYLVRRRDTFVIRLLLLPVTVCLFVHSAYRSYFPQPWLVTCNWTQRILWAQMVSKALEYGLTPAGRLKVGETKLPPIGGEKDARAPSSPTAKIRASKSSFLPPAVNDALEVLSACRGHGWDFGKGVHLPKEHRPLERAGFLKATCKIFFKNFLLLDFLESCSKLVPALTSPSGGSMFLPLPPVQRYTVSTALHILTGTALIASLEIAYAFVTLAGVGVFQQSPLLWPPFLDHPFSSDSLSDFWAKRWHQLLRRSFVVYGGYPAFWLGSLVSKEVAKAFMVIGVFTASGLYHELSTDTMGRGFDKHITLFFVLQAFGVMGERVWYKVTGRKVQGWIGLIWVYFCIMVLGQPCVDAWYNRGLGTSVFIPAVISPTRNILWPILKRVHPIFQLLP